MDTAKAVLWRMARRAFGHTGPQYAGTATHDGRELDLFLRALEEFIDAKLQQENRK
jgi:hypothetical protein